MTGNRCSQCEKPLSTEPVYRRACCKGCFYQCCIKDRHLKRCPCCRLDSLQNALRMLLWIPVVSLIVDDKTDQCPAKRWRVRDDDDDEKTCVICLEEYTKMAKVTLLVYNGIMTHRPPAGMRESTERLAHGSVFQIVLFPAGRQRALFPSTLMYCEQYYQKWKQACSSGPEKRQTRPWTAGWRCAIYWSRHYGVTQTLTLR